MELGTKPLINGKLAFLAEVATIINRFGLANLATLAIVAMAFGFLPNPYIAIKETMAAMAKTQEMQTHLLSHLVRAQVQTCVNSSGNDESKQRKCLESYPEALRPR